MKSIIIFLLIFSIIVVIHEFGHFYFARKAGILVREFALGMGPKLFSKQGKDGTTYTVRMLPLGGYVRLAGLNEEEELEPGMAVGLLFDEDGQVRQIDTREQLEIDALPVRVNAADLSQAMQIDAIEMNSDELQSFRVAKNAKIIEKDGTFISVAPVERRYESASVWDKIKTNIAGPINNFILSILVFTLIGFMMGVKAGDQFQIHSVVENSPAQKAGLKTDDILLALDGQSINTQSDIGLLIHEKAGQKVAVTVERNGEKLEKILIPETITDKKSGEKSTRLGIQYGPTMVDMTLMDHLAYGFVQSFMIVKEVLSVILGWFTQGFKLNDLGGPVAMAQATNQVVSYGPISILLFMGAISANLGVMNLLPIPALDGGKIVLNLFEAIRGKPLSQEKEGMITLVGVAILFILMVLVTWNDIMRLF